MTSKNGTMTKRQTQLAELLSKNKLEDNLGRPPAGSLQYPKKTAPPCKGAPPRVGAIPDLSGKQALWASNGPTGAIQLDLFEQKH